MQSNRTQAAEHARDQRGKGQPQQEAKRKRTGTRRILRAIRGRFRGRTSMRRHRKKGVCVLRAVCWVEASQPARTAAKAVAQTGWKPQRNRGRQSRFNFTPALFAPQQRGQRENPVSDGNTSLAHGVGASTLGFHALVRCAPNHPHPLSWKGTPPCARRTLCKVAAGRRHHIRKDQR